MKNKSQKQGLTIFNFSFFLLFGIFSAVSMYVYHEIYRSYLAQYPTHRKRFERMLQLLHH